MIAHIIWANDSITVFKIVFLSFKCKVDMQLPWVILMVPSVHSNSRGIIIRAVKDASICVLRKFYYLVYVLTSSCNIRMIL